MNRIVSSSNENIPKGVQLQFNNAILNSPFSKEIILEIEDGDVKMMNSTFYDKLTKVFFENLSRKLDLFHQRAGKVDKMPERIKFEIKTKLVNDQKKWENNIPLSTL
ncbi:hypothetical protein [Chryseobacterium sp. 52]|uniref:hypothetical protein n=1 Tax=Chryseobacterium sp. 52 TaxID=2035213 RepID=UPI000C192C92|nr:hypothetical protein [Chryseobacterium sp. 52]